MESDSWLASLSTDIPSAISDTDSPRDTPLRLIVRLFPDLAHLVFDRCIDTNLQTETKQAGYWKGECVTADNSDFKITFNYELLDDTYILQQPDGGELDPAECTDGEEWWGPTDLWNYSGKLHPKAVTYSSSKLALRRNHPLMIMIEEQRTVIVTKPSPEESNIGIFQ